MSRMDKMITAAISCLLLLAVSVSAYSPGLIPHEAVKGEVATRRNFMVSSSAALASSVLLQNPGLAFAEEGLTDFQDENCKFSIKVPAGWERSEQSLPDRRKIVLYIKPDSDQKTLMFFAYTPVRGDITTLGSFGSVDEVAQATILPKSTVAGVKDVTSQMLSAESKKQAYFFDYLTKIPSQPETHFRTIFSLAQGAAGGSNVLVSITAQAPTSEYDSLKPVFDKIMDSYK